MPASWSTFYRSTTVRDILNGLQSLIAGAVACSRVPAGSFSGTPTGRHPECIFTTSAIQTMNTAESLLLPTRAKTNKFLALRSLCFDDESPQLGHLTVAKTPDVAVRVMRHFPVFVFHGYVADGCEE